MLTNTTNELESQSGSQPQNSGTEETIEQRFQRLARTARAHANVQPASETTARVSPEEQAAAHARRAEQFLRDGQLENARDALVMALMVIPHEPQLMTALGNVLLRLGFRQEAEVELLKAMAFITQEPLLRASLTNALLAVGTSYYDAGFPNRARLSFERALRITPGNEIAIENIKIMEEAGFTKTEIIENGDTVATVEKMREGFNLAEVGDYDGAIVVFEAITSELPNHIRANSTLGTLWLAKNQFDTAVQYFELASDISPSDTSILNQLGVARAQAGDIVGAEEAFWRTIEIMPSNLDALLSLSHLYRAERRYTEAADCLQRAANLAALEPDVIAAAAILALEIGDRKSASFALNELLTNAPSHPAIEGIKTQLEQPSANGG